jgi:glycosyltransferase involved in cell wall biosynthesis
MTNVLLVTQRFYPPWSDGTVSYAHGLADAILETSKLGKKVELTALSLTEKTWFPKLHHHELKTYLEQKKVGLEWFHTPEKRYQLNLWKLVKKLSKSNNYDVVHIICLGLDPVVMHLGINNKQKTFVAKHLFVFPFHSSFPAEKVAYTLFRKSKAFKKMNIDLVFSSTVLRDIYGASEATILPPAVNVNLYSPNSKVNDACNFLMASTTKFGNATDVLQRDSIVLYMGPLSRERFDWRTVIGGFTKLCKVYGVNAGLIVVGRGFEKLSFFEEIKNYIQKKNLEKRVFLCLHDLTEAEKICLFNSSHIFLYPFPGTLHRMSVVFPPIALLESMSAGLCVVTGGLPHLDSLIRNHTNGVLLKDCITAKTIADAMWDAIINKKDISKNARLTIENCFSIQSVSKMYSTFLSKHGM